MEKTSLLIKDNLIKLNTCYEDPFIKIGFL